MKTIARSGIITTKALEADPRIVVGICRQTNGERIYLATMIVNKGDAPLIWRADRGESKSRPKHKKVLR